MKRRTPTRSTRPSPATKPLTPAARPRNLPQQEADFTAEGAPPPGLVGAEPPVQTEGVQPGKPAKDPGHATD